MFSKTITESDAFLDLPLSTQALYFHLCMYADDDGFLSGYRKIMRMVGASQNEYDLLVGKRFIIQFDDGIVLIKHWLMHNYLRKDRYTPSVYTTEKSMVFIKANKAYTLDENQGVPALENSKKPVGIPSGAPDGIPLVDVDKSSIDKSSKEYYENHIEALEMNADYDFKLVRSKYKGTKTLANAKKKLPKLINTYTVYQMCRTVDRYNKFVIEKRKTQPNLHYLNESTFWNGRYEDYLDENYETPKQKKLSTTPQATWTAPPEIPEGF